MICHTSKELKAAIEQYLNGLISETEFLAWAQVDMPVTDKLMKYNTSEMTHEEFPALGTLDDFHQWNAPIPTTEPEEGSCYDPEGYPPLAPEWKEATRIKLKYKNHTLAAIMLRLAGSLGDGLEMYVSVQEDTPRSWAIHTSEQYYYTVQADVKAVCERMGVEFKAAGTGNPDWDLFCSAT